MTELKTHKNLEVWQDSIELVTMLYKVLDNFPSDEKYGLISQIKRASVSVPANISEGAARGGNKEYIHFCYISLGSLSELETLIIISRNLNLIDDSDFRSLSEKVTILIKKLLNFIKYLKTKVV